MRMYDELADWWPLLSHPDEYAEEAVFFAQVLASRCQGPLRTMLELGSGGGNNAWHLQSRVQMVLVEPSANMRDVSRRLNPACEHVAGDMRTVRLGRQFDAVFVHDAVAYMTTPEDLRRAMETAFIHTRPGGAAVFAPDHLRETFSPATDCGGRDDARRGLRYLEWDWDPDPSDTMVTTEYILALRSEDGSMRVEHDRHITGLFARAEWLEWLRDVGFEAEAVPFDHSELEAGTYEVFACRRPIR